VSDIDTAVVDSLKALDPQRPIREADVGRAPRHVAEVPLDYNLAVNYYSETRCRGNGPLSTLYTAL
jgi:hypothetical protein